MIAKRQLCTFYLDNHFFGVDAQSIQEVIRYQEMTRVPLTPECVSGLINLRGQIVTAIDMRKRLGLKDRSADKLPMNVVIRSDEGAVSLLVDQIGDVIEVASDDFESPPEILRGPARDLVQGAYKLEGKLLLLLDTTEAVQLTAVG
jgi:purine-binding chemotaxis protein CheW